MTEFHIKPIGQGLFYTGNITLKDRCFNFVYDCGAKCNEKERENLIACYLEDCNKKVDMVVISHFDDDHINGIPYLLKNLESPLKFLYIPYYDPSSYLMTVIWLYAFEIEKNIESIIFVHSTSETENSEERIDLENLNSFSRVYDPGDNMIELRNTPYRALIKRGDIV